MSSATNSRQPRFSVVIVTYNSIANIRVCLESLRKCCVIGGMASGAEAGGSHEIIVVDNDSRDGTGAFLAAQDDIRAVHNRENHGFSKGCNQGAAIATGEFLIFLNPDTLVTPGWSESMVRHFQDPSVGAVGPVSNYVAGLQRLDLNLPPAWREAKSFPGENAAEVAHNLARILREGNAGKVVSTRLLIGFCLMMPRALYEAMDGMDENLFLGNDDLDLSWRLGNLGRKLVVASDAFVFHEGQKSFQTRAKTTVERLTQESTDALYVKLVHHYGGRDKVPSPVELWGIGWFNPSPALLQGDIPALPAPAGLAKNRNAGIPVPAASKQAPEAKVKTESRELNAWKAVTILVYLGPQRALDGSPRNLHTPESAVSRLERTLSTLPSRAGTEIIVLNCTGSDFSGAAGAVPLAPAGATLRKLDLGSDISLKQVLEIALALMPGTHGLFCLAGVEFSAMFNHWLDKRDLGALPACLSLPLRIGDGELRPAHGAYAFLSRKEWLRQALASQPVAEAASAEAASAEAASIRMSNAQGASRESESLAKLGERLSRAAGEPASGKPADPPWLLARLSDLPGMENAAPMADPVALYPESLRDAMREAKSIGFAGTSADPPPQTGPFRALDPQGNLLPVSGQDLIILRVTPDLIDGLAERLANIRRLAPGLKRLIVVGNGADALRLPAEGLLPAADLTPEGIRAALWRAGFAVTGEKPYRGFPGGTSGSDDLQGWIQVESAPRSTAHRTEKMVSIVILGFNQVEYTKKCVESIRRHTRQKYELILIDNGSKDGTEAFFRSIPGAKVVRNPRNLGVSKGWNQGMRLAVGEYILILNNDIIVGPDWLENMVRLAESDPGIGLVGPRSNYIAGPQAVADVPYQAESDIQGFIRKWQGEHSLSAAEFRFIKGFCHLIPRRVFEKVGFYDERFGKGNFEDDDYCMRVHVHGYRALFADDSFIHHYGSVSFNQESVDWRALMIENQKKYEEKWAKGASAIHDTQVSHASEVPSSKTAAASAAAAGNPATDALTQAMITISAALAAPSTLYPADRPAHAASAAGAAAPSKLNQGLRAFENGDLPRARALFLEAQSANPADPEPYCCLGVLMFSEGATQEAVSFFMGSLNLDPGHEDAARNLLDTLEARNGKVSPGEIAALLRRYPGNPVFSLADAAPAASEGPAVSGEAVSAPAWTPALPAWRVDVERFIDAREYGHALDILEKRGGERETAGVRENYLGIIAHACGDAEMALTHFTAALVKAPGDTDILFNLSDTLIALGRYGEAAKLLEDSAHKTGVEADPDLPDLAATAEQIRHALSQGAVDADHLLASRDANQRAEKLLRSGAPADAKAYLDAALETNAEDFRAHNNMGLMAWYGGDGEEAWRRFQRCLSIRPSWSDALVNAFDTALALGGAERIRPCLENALSHAPGHVQALAMRRHLAAQGPAIHAFKSFGQLEANAALLGRAEKAMELARQGDAIRLFLEALDLQSQNPQAYNGLGIIAFGEKRHGDAFGLFDAASGLHPLDQDILMNFWQCAQTLRREGEVLPKLRNSLERNPALEDVKAIIKEYA